MKKKIMLFALSDISISVIYVLTMREKLTNYEYMAKKI